MLSQTLASDLVGNVSHEPNPPSITIDLYERGIENASTSMR
jgi:hypothetical protein